MAGDGVNYLHVGSPPRGSRRGPRKANFAGSRALPLDPATNQVRGASIPIEAAMLLAASFGLKVT